MDKIEVEIPEDGGSKVLRNVGKLPQHYMVTQPRTHRLNYIFLNGCQYG